MTATYSRRFISGLVLALLILAATGAEAAPIRSNAGFGANTLAANDDGSTGLVPIGFPVNFFGLTYNNLYVNNNGNVTFDASLGTFTPFDLTATGRQIIAPFFADVDTRSHGLEVTYGSDVVNGRPAFGVNYIDVDYFSSTPSHGAQLNSFQLVLIDRSDTGADNFDIEFNFDKVLWETGNASNGSGGLGGNSARVGFSNGTGDPGSFFELPGSAVNGAFLDSGPSGTSLIQNSRNSPELGRYVFQARNGSINPRDVVVPEPTSLAIWAVIGLTGFAARRSRRKKR